MQHYSGSDKIFIWEAGQKMSQVGNYCKFKALKVGLLKAGGVREWVAVP
jgi:hypothetical protein